MATAAETAAAIQAQLAARAAAGSTGAVSVTVDGVATTFDERQAREALAYWQRRAAEEAGGGRIARTLDLRGAW
jgi:hypothetical protein